MKTREGKGYATAFGIQKTWVFARIKKEREVAGMTFCSPMA
jgi:hypothetical protein